MYSFKKYAYRICFSIASLFLIASFSLALAQNKVKRVSVLSIVEHPSLNAVRDGVFKQLKAEGFEPDKNLILEYQNAQGNLATATQIAQRFIGKNPDVIVAIATPTAQVTATATKTIPIIYTTVTDPIAAKLIKDWKPSGTNIAGVSDQLPLEKQMALIRKIVPKAKRIGILYSPGEINSVVVVKALEKMLPQYNQILIAAPVARTVDIAQAAKSLIGKVDAIYISADNNVVAAIEALVKVANDAKIPLFSADINSVERGAIGTLGIDYQEMGRQTGHMVARILRGEKPGSIASEITKKYLLVFNLSAAKKQGVTIPKELLDSATLVIQ